MRSRELFRKLKEMAKDFNIQDLINVRIFLEEDMKYLPEEYREHYLRNQIMYFINTLKEIKKKKVEDIEDYPIDEKKLKDLFKRIENFKRGVKGEDSFIKLSKIVVPYLIFMERKPLHPLGTRFPGGKGIVRRGNEYYCPAKSKQRNEYSLCEFCVCKGL
ncbi:MAG TPA: DUF2115 domain-containing protein [Methanothermococcus okinawensis]|uniref:UPF0305 protein EYH15_00365 n=1 Tax=Methanothermococcus okinawensis TaxID=155863 RepID=A0A832ZAF5_9EURY|nr:DUF2115 domain-containing protein [Methanococcaceae archaeon]HIP83940.1 DUF2115 domain-containing protein [Methanothermococcus okinawensis]HIP91541.1 DUF2115 domain-containing protein [Methanothermococcus okinawensis]